MDPGHSKIRAFKDSLGIFYNQNRWCGVDVIATDSSDGWILEEAPLHIVILIIGNFLN